MSAYFTSLLLFNITCYLLPTGRMIVNGIFERILDYRDVYHGSILICQWRDWGTPRNSRSGEIIWRSWLECGTSLVRNKTADAYIMAFSIGIISYTEQKYPVLTLNATEHTKLSCWHRSLLGCLNNTCHPQYLQLPPTLFFLIYILVYFPHYFVSTRLKILFFP
jgi:hypothetical protein